MTISQAIRASVPLGINVEPRFLPISDSLRTPSLIPPSENVIDEEIRRNTFWLLYAMERMVGCSNGWALSLDDHDVSQLLPMKGTNFELGVSMIFAAAASLRFYANPLACRLRGPGPNGSTLWEKTFFFFILKTKSTRSTCISKALCCCRELKHTTCASAPSVSLEIPHLSMLLHTPKCGRRTVMRLEMGLLIRGGLPASSKLTISDQCSDKVSRYICAIPFVTVVSTRICILLRLCPICA